MFDKAAEIQRRIDSGEYQPLTCSSCQAQRHYGKHQIYSHYVCGLDWICQSCGLRQEVSEADMSFCKELPERGNSRPNLALLGLLTLAQPDPTLTPAEVTNFRLQGAGFF